ncbi:MAG: efflux RND transporter periplasmic adaptor subunit [Haliscomenobacter sp.]|nr:efflux RND transporter periplasmic adaptor subunit [Haliscomenobacter sp.]
MKKSFSTISLALLLVSAGIGIGYLVFGGRDRSQPMDAAGGITKDAATEYTCSMHPQIRQSEPGICPLCEMDLTPVESGNEDQPTLLVMTDEAIRLAQIQTTRVGSGTGSGKRISLSGKIMADERRITVQTAHIPGRIEHLSVAFTGEQVKKGQPLARLYSPALINAQRELLEAIRLKGGNSELAEAARTRIRYWKLPEDFIQKVEQTGQVQKEVWVKADQSGVVSARKVALGDYVEEGMPLFELTDLRRVWALLEAYESDLPHIRVGDAVEITTPAAPGKLYKARVAFIDPLLDAESRTVAIRAELENPVGLFKPEMFVQGTLVASRAGKSALIVPKSAVLWTGKRSVVYVKVPNAPVPSFEFREVELADATHSGYLVLSGLEAGEEVVTEGAFAIDAAAQLNNQASMINRMVSQDGMPQETIPDLKAFADKTFFKQWSEVIRNYLLLKDAMVATKLTSGQKAADALVKSLNQVDPSGSTLELQAFWENQVGSMKAHTRNIAEASMMEIQRKQFFFLSELVIRNVRSLGSGDQPLFLQHCPMAFNNQGGDWVSAQRQIMNPYFGDEMLHCGIVKDSFLVLNSVIY